MDPAADSPILSICVPTFNRARYLDCLLQDLATQIGDLGWPYELLIGDNASVDETLEVVRKYQDQLNIRYFPRSENVGPYHNLTQLWRVARGRYSVYLADDDLLIPGVLGRYIGYLEANPDVGAVFAPWSMIDKVSGEHFGSFYSVARETRIEAGHHAALFDLLVDGHIFPEICVTRTSLVQQVAGGANQFAFYFFVQIAAMVDRMAVTFQPEPFYTQVTRYFEGETRSQAGIEEVKVAWDRYRGGLEYLLARFASRTNTDDLIARHAAIDSFTRIRMHVGLRIRTAEGKDWVDNYYLANRLRSAGHDSLLPAPYETYRINAALEYLLQLQPFAPATATICYYLDDVPEVLAQARDFAAAGLVPLADRSLPLPPNAVLIGSGEGVSVEGDAFIVSEAELLARFP
jgi:glycosyltransferase involved in cell wall biosynthesis